MMEEAPDDVLEAAQSFLAMDDPRHASHCAELISAAFTPKQLRKRIDDRIREQAVRIVDDLLATTEHGDFVAQVSKRLPMWTIYEMLGLPDDQRVQLAAELRRRHGVVGRRGRGRWPRTG